MTGTPRARVGRPVKKGTAALNDSVRHGAPAIVGGRHDKRGQLPVLRSVASRRHWTRSHQSRRGRSHRRPSCRRPSHRCTLCQHEHVVQAADSQCVHMAGKRVSESECRARLRSADRTLTRPKRLADHEANGERRSCSTCAAGMREQACVSVPVHIHHIKRSRRCLGR